MPRQRQAEVTEATRLKIKETARELMAEKGTAGLSLRAIARVMEMTAPAIYHYFPSLDDLITALIVDAFTSHADTVRQARNQIAAGGNSCGEQLFAAVLAYRQWALAHPIDFQLIYGNPIPGYSAPGAVTTPAARKLGAVFMEVLILALETGEVTVPESYCTIPPSVRAHYQSKFELTGEPAALFHLMNHMWSFMHGMVTLEIYNHAAPVVGDTDAFYEQAIRHQFHLMGIVLP
ncbi:MAG: TetR/AcrR family transcriptional regulator [Caldilineaceae bacterium]|nr:TetR/AcrR family transcriptional regulator [Caldilineaceae bacterium]